MWDPRSPPRDGTHTPAVDGRSLSHRRQGGPSLGLFHTLCSQRTGPLCSPLGQKECFFVLSGEPPCPLLPSQECQFLQDPTPGLSSMKPFFSTPPWVVLPSSNSQNTLQVRLSRRAGSPLSPHQPVGPGKAEGLAGSALCWSPEPAPSLACGRCPVGVFAERVRDMRVSLRSSSCVCVRAHTQLCPTLHPPWTAARQPSPSMGFSRKEYRSGLPWPPPGDLPDPGIEPASLVSPTLAVGLFITREAQIIIMHAYNQFSRETFVR